MSKWIEIPPRRILEVNGVDLVNDSYKRLDKNGMPVREGDILYRVVRQSDGKVFKPAEFIPATHQYGYHVWYLEEI